MSLASTNRPIGRPKKKPSFNAAAVLTDLIEAVTESYNSPDDNEEHKPITRVAEEFEITPLKVRKLLITGGAYRTPTNETVLALFREGKTITQIQEATGLGRASVHSYLPYSKGAYKGKEISTDAERVQLYRMRKAAIKSLSVETLWDAVDLYADFPFHTAKGLKFTYTVKGNELFVNRKEKSITRATVELAYQRVQGEKITGPKQIGTFGASYLYPLFVRFGIIEAAPEQIRLFGKTERRSEQHE